MVVDGRPYEEPWAEDGADVGTGAFGENKLSDEDISEG